jgi:hypothetical protein
MNRQAEAAKGSGELAQNVNGVAQAVQITSHGAEGSQKTAQDLARTSAQLREIVWQFKLKTNGQSRRRPHTHVPGRPTREEDRVEVAVR